ncbi:hypothetical protein FS837_010885, partial [Tulasnella sp. UAMH 9824]
MLEGYTPQAVATALPNFHHVHLNFDSNHALQAQLILQWDANFGSQVLEVWKPSDRTWTEVFGRAMDAKLAIRLALPSLGRAGVRSVIAATGAVYGGEKLVILMAALSACPDDTCSKGLPTPEPGTSAQSTEQLHRILPATPSVNNKPLQPPLNERPAKSKMTTNLPTPSAQPPLASITSLSPSQAIGPTPLVSRHPFTPGSAKENVHPSASKDYRNSASRPARLPSTQEHSATFQLLFAQDDARRLQATPLKTFSTAQPPQPSAFRNATNLPDLSTSIKPQGDEANHDPVPEFPSNVTLSSSNRTQASRLMSPNIFLTAPLDPIAEEEGHCVDPSSPSPRRKPTPVPSIPDDEVAELGLERVNLTVPREAVGFPSVDSFNGEMDVDYEREDCTEGGSDGGSPSKRDGKDYSQSERGRDSEDGHSTPEDDDDEPLQEDYSDGEVDPVALNPWTWSQEINDEKVDSWGIEDFIGGDPCSTAPVRTRWMYEARKGDKSDEEYSELLRGEHVEFMKIPVACRAAAGQMWYKDSMLDWEVRVFWAPLVYQYALLKDKCEAAEEDGDVGEVKKNEANRRSLASEAVAKLMVRFPDLSPDHERRRIQETYGKKGLSKYLAKFRNKFTSDAGQMKILYQKNVGKVGIIGASVSMSTMLEILGRNKAKIAYHLWGRTKEGKAECDEEIAQNVNEWEEENPQATPYDVNQYRIKVVQDVRMEKFKLLGDAEKERWKKRAKSILKPASIEEEQCFVEATLPHVVDLFKLLAEQGNMHFVLLAASKASVDIPIIVQEFGRKDPHQPPFLSASDGLGARIRSRYIDYALQRFGGGIEDAAFHIETDMTGDLGDDVEQESPGFNGGSRRRHTKQAVATPAIIPPFKPDLSETKSMQKMAKAISDFVIMGVEKLHRTRATWDKLTREAPTYILVDRMPIDPDVPGQRLQLQKPAAMTFPRLKAFFKFLVASYDGTLSDHECFRFRLQSRHSNIPTPVAPVDPNVHHAGVAAAKTKLPKRTCDNTKPRQRKAKRAREEEEETFEDLNSENYDGLMEELDEAFLQDALTGKDPWNPLGQGKAVRVQTPLQSSTTSRTPHTMPYSELKESRPTTNFKPVAVSAPDRPTCKPRPRPKPKSAIEIGTDTLSHPLLFPTDEGAAETWKEVKQYLDIWGANMTHLDEQYRKIPFVGLSGIKPGLDLPAAIYSSICIMQLWSVFQPDAESEFGVTLLPNLGLNTLEPS